MVLISVLELLPEATAVEGLGAALAVAALGAGFVFALHLIIPHVHLVEEHGRDPRAQRSAYLVAFGLILHDVPEGFAMANAYIVIGFIDRESPLGQEYLAHQAENVFYRHARFFAAAEVEALLELAVGDDGAVASCSAWTGAGNSPARGRAAVRGDPVSGGERRPALPADSTG